MIASLQPQDAFLLTEPSVTEMLSHKVLHMVGTEASFHLGTTK